MDVNQKLTKDMMPKTETEIESMKSVPYKEVLGSLMYAYLSTRPDLGCAITILNSFAENPEKTSLERDETCIALLKGIYRL